MEEIKLPQPKIKGNLTLEECIKKRRTIRTFKPHPLVIEDISQLLWAAYGITDDNYKKSVPSAGALYPLDIYAIIGKNGVKDLKEGIYHYNSQNHSIRLIKEGDYKDEIVRASLSQSWMKDAPMMILITIEFERITIKYGKRGERYAYMEAGSSYQNVFLQAISLGLSCGIVGAFNDNEIIKICSLPENYLPVIIMPIGYAK